MDVRQAKVAVNDLTVIYYTANTIDDYFMAQMQYYLTVAIGDLPLISVSQKPLNFGQNVHVEFRPSHLNIYRQALIGALKANTKYIALAEDDVLYSPDHFKHRSDDGFFAYNMSAWNIYTWTSPPMFSHKANGRKNLNGLICERELFIEAMQERFHCWPDDDKVNPGLWAEPGKYERQLGVAVRETEVFYTNPPNVVFSHKRELSFKNLGERKRLGEFRALELPYWGTAEHIMEMYK